MIFLYLIVIALVIFSLKEPVKAQTSLLTLSNMEYKYPQIDRTQGYAWNALERIEQEVGLRPTAIGDSSGATFVTFSRELTAPEKILLDALMASNPTVPPTSANTKFVIRDVWTQKSFIETAMGLPYKVFYSQSTPGSGIVDQIEIQFNKVLTTQERNKVISEYSKLITIK